MTTIGSSTGVDPTSPPPAAQPPPTAALTAAGSRWAELIELPSQRGQILHVGSSGEHSGHAIDDFAMCAARYAFKHVLRALEPDPNQPFAKTTSLTATTRGSLGHQGLGLHYRRMMARQKGEDPEAFAEPFDGVVRMAHGKGPLYTEELDLVLDTLEFYFRAHRGETLQILGVEQVYPMAAWLQGRPHTRSVDLVATDASGLIYFLDHKFTGRLPQTYVDSLTMDGQMLDYELLGSAIYGERWGGAWVNGIRWPDPGGRFPRLKPELLRARVDPAPWAVQHRPADLVWRYAQRDALRGAVDPWQWPCTPSWGACEAGSGCPAKALCRFGPQGSPQFNTTRG